jgi:outer membrane protein TolC
VGLELTLPLRGGIDTRSELKKSMLEKKSHLWELKDIEVTLANEIDSAIDQITNAEQQLEYSKQIVALNQQLLETEKNRLTSGKSSSRLVLEKEDSYRIAQEDALKSRVRVQTALIDLQLAEGSILLNYDVEVLGREE